MTEVTASPQSSDENDQFYLQHVLEVEKILDLRSKSSNFQCTVQRVDINEPLQDATEIRTGNTKQQSTIQQAAQQPLSQQVPLPALQKPQLHKDSKELPVDAHATHSDKAALESSINAAQPSSTHAKVPSKPSRLRQLFDYLVVYDLEATCDKEKQLHPQEIIELSAVVVNTRTLQLEGRYQQYCRPTAHPLLTDFCTQLTGITQQQVDAGLGLEAALGLHSEWLREKGVLGSGKTCVPVTWSDWDLKVQMAGECKWRKVQMPKHMERWVDLRAVFVKHYNQRFNLRGSVQHAGLQWEGRAHSGLDDAENTARLAVKLMQRGVILGITGSFTGVDASGKLRQSTLFKDRPAKKARVFDAAGTWSGQCHCGAKAKKRMVKRPGPTNGREFWSCGKYTATEGARCDFFKWIP